MNISPVSFNRLDPKDRLLILACKGEFISEIVYYGYRIKLYILDSMYVEVFTNIHSGLVEQIELLLPEEERLNLYITDVDLQPLFK